MRQGGASCAGFRQRSPEFPVGQSKDWGYDVQPETNLNLWGAFMSGIKTEEIMLQVADGTTMKGYVAAPEGTAKLPAMLVFQEAFGVNAHIRDVADRFAAAGYFSIAPELFHRSGPGFEGAYDNFPAVMPHMQALTVEGMSQDVQSAYGWLQTHPRVLANSTAGIGFCMGGRVSFLANSLVPLKAAVSFYGGGIAPALLPRAAEQHAPILLVWGGLDKHIPPEQIRGVTDALRQANKPFINVEFSDADHGFFCDARASYNKSAAAVAWPMVLKFLETHIKG
jgi:carboxymethylenebutenolidase